MEYTKSANTEQPPTKPDHPEITPQMLLNESIEKRTTLYVGNISSDTTKEDIMELFHSNTTKYLRDKSSAELCFNTKSKYKGYAYLNIPHHISTEILKLDGFEYNSRKLTIQKAVNPTFNHRTDKSFLPYNRRGDAKRRGQSEKPCNLQ